MNEKVRKILEAKYNLGLNKLVLPTAEGASAMAFDPYAVGVKDLLIEEAITVVQNKRALIPMVNLQDPKIATLAIGSSQPTMFQNRLDSYVKAKQFFVPSNLKDIDIPSLLKDLKGFSRVIVSIHALTNKPADNFGLTKDILQLVQNLNRQQEIIVVVLEVHIALSILKT